MQITYTINSENESLEFESYEDIIKTPNLPDKIKRIIIRANYYDETKFVDIYIKLSNSDWFYDCELKLSSSKEDKLLLIQDKITKLLEQNKASYYWLFSVPFAKNGIHGFLAFLFVVFIIISTFVRFKPYFTTLSENSLSVILILYVIFGFGVGLLIKKFLEYLYPYVEFRLSDRKSSLRDNLKKVFWLIISGLFITAMYDLIKLFYNF